MSASFNPYAAPEAPPEVRVGLLARRARRAGICLGTTVALWVLAFTAGEIFGVRASRPRRWSPGSASWRPVSGCVLALMAMGRAASGPSPKVKVVVLGLALALLHAAMAFFGGIVALFSLGGGRGRQLRRRGQVLLPRLQSGSAWSHTDARCDVDDRARGGLADQWRENARTEHASVGAFAMLTMDLMALGAPPELLAAANRDALDEYSATRRRASRSRPRLTASRRARLPSPRAARPAPSRGRARSGSRTSRWTPSSTASFTRGSRRASSRASRSERPSRRSASASRVSRRTRGVTRPTRGRSSSGAWPRAASRLSPPCEAPRGACPRRCGRRGRARRRPASGNDGVFPGQSSRRASFKRRAPRW